MRRRVTILGISVLLTGLLGGLTACAPSTSFGTSAPTTPPRAAAVQSAVPTVRQIPSPPPLPERPPLKTTSELIQEMVLYSSKEDGAVLTSSGWQDLSDYICNDLAAGGAGLFTPDDVTVGLSEEAKMDLATMYLDGAIEGNCTTATKPRAPAGVTYKTDFSLALPAAFRGDLTDNDIAYSRLLREYSEELVAYGHKYNVDVSGLLAVLPDPFVGSSGSRATGGGPGGYPVACSDGWVSSSGGKQGACSHHGGIR